MDMDLGEVLVYLVPIVLRDFLPWAWDTYQGWKHRDEPDPLDTFYRDWLQVHEQYQRHLDAKEYDALKALFERELKRTRLKLGIEQDSSEKSDESST